MQFPGANETDTAYQTLVTGPVAPSSPSGFYAALLELRRWWATELAKEGMMELHLPSSGNTNGTYLKTQAVAAIVRSMITRQNVWHPRYGTSPGLGDDNRDGLPEVFTSTATAALEMGAMPYAKGVIDNYLRFFVRDDGMLTHHGTEVPASARVLTVFALYDGYSGGSDAAFMLEHFSKAKALGDWLLFRRSLSLKLAKSDARYGIPQGDAEAENFPYVMYHQAAPLHFYSSASEMYRAFTELGAVWVAVGKKAGRADVSEHGAKLLAAAPLLRADLHTSLNRTVYATGNPAAPRCWPFVAEVNDTGGQMAHPHRGYPQLLYSGVLTAAQVDDIFNYMGNVNRSLTLGVPGWGTTISTRAPFGMAFALLQNDMIERFLLHFYAVSAHAHTRGTWVTPESVDLADRDAGSAPYASTGVHMVPTYLKWMLCFEEPETRTLWLGKAVPRDWLRAGETPIVATGVTTRYGRLSFRLTATATAGGRSTSAVGYSVHVNVTMPAGDRSPAGGLRVRVRAPLEHAGKMSAVTVGGKPWPRFDAGTETVDFTADELTPALRATGLPRMVAIFT